MKIRFRHSNSGIALIIVLLVIVVLGILAGGFAYSMKVETKLARNATFDAELEWLGRSGVELARYILAQSANSGGGQMFDALNQKWAGGLGDTNDLLANIPMENYQLGNGSFSVRIVDLDRKFNINVATPEILRQALTLIGVEATSFSEIVDSVSDWRDPDDNEGLTGAESDYYKKLSPPYVAKNGPIDDLTELLLIKGITPGMYWGASGGGQASALSSLRLGGQRNLEEPIYTVGLVDLFTPLSGRALNINTASATALQVIPFIDENIAQAIITRRAGPDGVEGNEDDIPFRNPADLAGVIGMGQLPPNQSAQFFSVRSYAFEVRVDAQIGSYKRQYVALLRRNSPRDIQVLNLYWQ